MSVIRRPQMVLIDLDGTLVDSVSDLAYCVDTMMTKLDRPAWGEEKVREWVGNGVERLVRRALIGQLHGEPDEGAFAQALPIFMDLYTQNVCVRSFLYPGVEEGLRYLRTAKYKVACVTNKASRFTDPLLKQLGIYDQFDLVVSGDTTAKKKPDPMPLLYAAQQCGVAPSASLMVGDSSNDVTAARSAGFQIVCVPYGYNHGEDIRLSKPDVVIESLAELRLLLDQAT